MRKYSRGMGWFNESHRHSLARQGVKTGRKSISFNNLSTLNYFKKDISKLYKKAYGKVLKRRKSNPIGGNYLGSYKKSGKSVIFYNDLWNEYRKAFFSPRYSKVSSEGPYFPYKISYSKIDYSMLSKLQSFLHKNFNLKSSKQPKDIQNSKDVVETRNDIEKITNWSKFRDWVKKHKTTILLLGLGGLLGIASATAGVPVIMENATTGEIVAIGGTFIGKYGMIGQTVLTGAGVMSEAKVIDRDTQEKLLGQSLVSPEELKVEQKTVVFKVKEKKPVDMSMKDYGDLEQLSSPPIPYSQLTKKEQKVLNSSIRKVKETFKKWGEEVNLNSKNLQICKRVGPDDTAFGAHQGDLIQIDRDILKDQDKTEGVLAHELIHKKFGVRDETRELENLQIDFMGLAID